MDRQSFSVSAAMQSLQATGCCLLTTSPDSSDEKLQRRLAEAQAVAARERARLSRAQSHRVVDDRPVDRAEVFDEERLALAPDARVASGDFRLGGALREVYVWEDVRLRISAPDEVRLLVEKERRFKLGRPRHDESRSSARGPQRGARCRDGL